MVVVLYGDHNPWLGDSASVYAELGIDLDVHTETGFLQYYSTRYVIWANEAAKAQLGNDFVGEGPRLSSNYLMNEVFNQLGWTGNAYMQLTEDVRQTLSVVTSNGAYVENGVWTEQLSEEGQQALEKLRYAQYDVRKYFTYGS